MKKLFGHKSKSGKTASGSRDFGEEASKAPIPTPLYQKLATHGNNLVNNNSPSQALPGQQPPPPPPEDFDRWEVVSQQTDPPQPSNPYPQGPSINGPSRTSSYTSLLPGPQYPVSTPLASPLPPRAGSPMGSLTSSTNAGGGNKLIRHHAKEREMREREAMFLQQRQMPPTQPLQMINGNGSTARRKAQAQTSAPVAMGILRALDPPRSVEAVALMRSDSEERRTVSDSGHREYREREVPPEREKKEKRGFWGTKDKGKEKEKDREKEMFARERDREKSHDDRASRKEDDSQQAELTRMIGYLTATASEDWALVLEVCERASASESNAKEAVRALRREFKYGEPPAQLAAARLWAIMLRNSSDMFISQSTSRKFLDTLEDLLSSSRTSPVVRERLLEIIAAAAYASGNKKGHDRDGFKGLWRRVKPFDKPDEGVPFDTDDAMFNPPTASTRISGYEIPQGAVYQDDVPVPIDSPLITPTPGNPTSNKRNKSPTRNRIIPPDEDIRRLFQECKIGQGNASLLSEALMSVRPEDLKKQEIIKEFYVKCRASQELIFAQIPWASAGAERSIGLKNQRRTHARKRTVSNDLKLAALEVSDLNGTDELTMEEKLLAALLAANADLMEALKQYDDLERVAMERLAENRSRKEVRMDLRQREQLLVADSGHETSGANANVLGDSSSRDTSISSRSNSPQLPTITRSQQYPHSHSNPQSRPQHLNLSESELAESNGLGQNLAPPPPAPHGPRSPAQVSISSYSQSRTPSPGSPNQDWSHGNGDVRYSLAVENESDEEEYHQNHKPSAKALGKRKVVEPEDSSNVLLDGNDGYFSKDRPYSMSHDPEDEEHGRYYRQPSVHYVYDAVAERTRQWQERLEAITALNGVH